MKKYEKDYTEEGFWNKIKKNAIEVGSKPIYVALILFYVMSKVTIGQKALIIGSLGYFISPLDLIPDFISIIGYLDDIFVLSLSFPLIRRNIDNEVKTKARNKFKSIFDNSTDDEIDKLIDLIYF